jgi:hypothetical protein
MDSHPFHYEPRCSTPGCDQPAVFKVAAPWSNGTSRELKNYGLACRAHREDQLARAREHRRDLALAEGETVGDVSLYQLLPGVRDTELSKLPDSGI